MPRFPIAQHHAGARKLKPAGFIEPTIPTVVDKPPTGPGWLHEIKHDGYRLMAWRDGDRVRLFTRRGNDWTLRYPWIARTALKLPTKSLLIDGEAVYCGEDGVADFDGLHSQANDASVFLYAFDLLSIDGVDIRDRPLEERKQRLRQLLRKPDGIRLSEDLDGDGATIFRHACKLRLEGIVSKRRDAPYRSGRSKTWLKTKNPDSPAMKRLDLP